MSRRPLAVAAPAVAALVPSGCAPAATASPRGKGRTRRDGAARPLPFPDAAF